MNEGTERKEETEQERIGTDTLQCGRMKVLGVQESNARQEDMVIHTD